jgi:hypothetical protein
MPAPVKNPDKQTGNAGRLVATLVVMFALFGELHLLQLNQVYKLPRKLQAYKQLTNLSHQMKQFQPTRQQQTQILHTIVLHQ